MGEQDRPCGAAVPGQPGQDRQRGGQRERPVGRRRHLLSAPCGAVHPGAALRARPGRPALPHQAPDRRGLGAARWPRRSPAGRWWQTTSTARMSRCGRNCGHLAWAMCSPCSPAPGSRWNGASGTDTRRPGGVLEVEAGPYGPEKPRRVLVATTDPRTLPRLCPWYLVTNLPAPGTEQAAHSALAAADAAEIVRLYGLRQWVEQSYKQTKYALGWHEYQVRSDRAIRRHWALVCCAFAFCWYHLSPPHPALAPVAREAVSSPAPAEPSSPPAPASTGEAGAGEKQQAARTAAAPAPLAGGAAGGARLGGALDHALALLARLVECAPTRAPERVA